MKNLVTLLPGLALLAAALPRPAAAQAPTITATTPAPHGVVGRAAPLTAMFSEPVTGASGIRMSGSMLRGNQAGSTSGDGTATLSFQPRQVLAPGERVQVSIPATVRSAAAGGAALAGGQVVEFRAAAGPATGTFGRRPLINQSYLGVDDLTLADLNGDGHLDLLYTDGSVSGGVSSSKLRLGNGQGGFGAAQAVGLEEGLTVADVDGDGHLDIITTGFVSPSSGLYVSYGDGRGGFPRSYVLPLPAKALYPRVGDVNGDGLPDLLVTEAVPVGAIRTEVLVRLGNGQGGFTAAPNLVLPAQRGLASGSFFLRDLNNDGRLDILFHSVPDSLRYTYLGNGQGGFAAAPGGPVPSAPIAELADLTGDGILDIVTQATSTNRAFFGFPRTLSVYAGLSTGGFAPTATATFTSLSFGRSGVRAADFDGDGDLDLLVGQIGQAPNDAPVGQTTIMHNDGVGTFTRALAVFNAGGLAAVGDVNNDGTLDAVVLDGDPLPLQGFTVLLNAPLPTAPAISGFSLATGTTAGQVVTLTGTNFTGTTLVTLNGVPVTGFTVVNATTITFTVPAGASGGVVAVSTATGTASSATALALAVRPAQALPGLALYPNPAHERVTVLLPTAGAATVALRDLTGRVVLAPAALAANGQLALPAALPAGVYLLEVQQNGTKAVRRIVKI